MTTHIKQPPRAVGLYDPGFEHDACGVALVARLDNASRRTRRSSGRSRRSRTSSTAAPRAPTRRTGDGAGILIQMPDEFFRARSVDVELPARRALRRRGLLPAARRAPRASARASARSSRSAAEGQRVVGWRDVPIGSSTRSGTPRACRAGGPPAVRRRGAPSSPATRTRSSASST